MTHLPPRDQADPEGYVARPDRAPITTDASGNGHSDVPGDARNPYTEGTPEHEAWERQEAEAREQVRQARERQHLAIEEANQYRLLVARERAMERRIAEQADPNNETPDSWRPVDLGPYLRGEVERPTPTVGIARSDGLRLLYPGKEHSVIGEMEAGKSWFSLGCVAAEVAAGNHVVYIHFEEADPSDTVERLLALGVTEEQLLTLFRFVGPERPVTPEALASLLDPAPSLVVLDGVNEAMALHKWGIREEDGAAEFRRRLVKPCLRAGAATLSADHVVKDREKRDRGPLGSIHKGNGLSGALILLENAEPFGRSQKGRSHVYVTKDRSGHLRRHGRADPKLPGKTFVGELVVDDTRKWNPWLELAFWAPRDSTEEIPAEAAKSQQARKEEDQVYEVVRDLIEKGETMPIRKIRGLVGLGHGKTRDALTRLVAAGRLTEEESERDSSNFGLTGSGEVPSDSDS